MLMETGLVQVRFAILLTIVRSCVLVNLVWSFSTFGGRSPHEGSRVGLELGTLRLHFELVVAVESSCILFVNTRGCVDLGACLRLSFGSSLDFKPVRLVISEEGVLVGLKDRSLRPKLHLFAEELCLVGLEPLAFHVGWNDSILHLLEGVSEGLAWFQLVSLTRASAKEFSSREVVLRRGVRNVVLEEMLLMEFEGWIVLHLLRNAFGMIVGAG